MMTLHPTKDVMKSGGIQTFFCLLCFLAPSIVANDLDSQTSDSGAASGRQRGSIWETTGRHLGDGGAASGRRRGGIWETTGRHLGDDGAAFGRRRGGI